MQASEPGVDTGFWDRNGYYVAPRLFTPAQMDGVVRLAKQAWDSRDDQIIADRQVYAPTDKRIRNFISALSDDDRKHRFILNDLYLRFPDIRRICLDPALIGLLRELLGKEPVLCQSLNFNWGTNQGYHQDTLYLPPPNEEDMIAIWIALEDISPSAGPLRYVPGSHNIPKFRFSTGKIKVVVDETAAWETHIAKYREQWGLKEEINKADKGDVFVWHAFLLHGGSDIRDFNLTRKSLVCHYYALDDLKAQGADCQQEFGGYWWKRVPKLAL
jgi:phytanoyl-CoA hydroxylase